MRRNANTAPIDVRGASKRERTKRQRNWHRDALIAVLPPSGSSSAEVFGAHYARTLDVTLIAILPTIPISDSHSRFTRSLAIGAAGYRLKELERRYQITIEILLFDLDVAVTHLATLSRHAELVVIDFAYPDCVPALSSPERLAVNMACPTLFLGKDDWPSENRSGHVT